MVCNVKKSGRHKESVYNTTRTGERICMNMWQAWKELQRKQTGRILIFDTVHIPPEFMEQCKAKGITIEFIH